MGLLRDWIAQKQDAKKREELKDIDLWKTIISMDASKMKPGFEQVQNDAFWKLYNKADKQFRPQLERMFPIMVTMRERRSRIGDMDKTPAGEGDIGTVKGDAGMGGSRPINTQGAVPVAASSKTNGQGTATAERASTAQYEPSQTSRGGLFKSGPEIEADAIRRAHIQNELDIEKATEIDKRKQQTTMAIDRLRKQENQQDIEALAKRYQAGEINDLTFQAEMTNLTSRSPEQYSTQEGVITFADGTQRFGAISDKQPNKILLVSPDGKTQEWKTAPPTARIDKVGVESEAARKDAIAFGAYAEKHGLDKNKLTDAQKLDALEEAKAKSGESGARLKEEQSIQRILHPNWSEAQINAEAAKKTEEYLNAQTQGARLGVQIRGYEIPGAGGSVTPPPEGSKQAPWDRFSSSQQALVTRGINAMVSDTSMGMAGSLRYQVIEARRLIQEATGITPEQLDARVETRKAARKSFDRMKLLASSVESLYTTLDRQAKILMSIRPQLPNSDITKINEWLQSGAREFNVGGVSEAAVRYGQALAAVRNDYARVIAGGSASIAQTSVEAIKAASDVIRPGFTAGNTNAMVDQMLTEGRQAIAGRQEQLNSLQTQLSQPLIPELYGQTYQEAIVPPITPPSLGGQAPAGSVPFSDGGKRYNIPATEVPAFLKDHPKAVRQ